MDFLQTVLEQRWTSVPNRIKVKYNRFDIELNRLKLLPECLDTFFEARYSLRVSTLDSKELDPGYALILEALRGSWRFPSSVSVIPGYSWHG